MSRFQINREIRSGIRNPDGSLKENIAAITATIPETHDNKQETTVSTEQNDEPKTIEINKVE